MKALMKQIRQSIFQQLEIKISEIIEKEDNDFIK